MNIFTDNLGTVITTLTFILSSFIPRFIAGSLILFIGLVIASLLKDLLGLIFKYFKISKWMEAAGLGKSQELSIWPNLLSELVRWTTIFIFLMSAVEKWGIPKVGDVLNQLLLFLPNVFVAVIIGWVGLVSARFASDIVRHGVGEMGGREALVLSNLARYTIVFFTVLIILTQLGVAAELVKILFTGIVAMLALSFGLAFGLGGKEEARKILEKLRERLDEGKNRSNRIK
ncbi:hypothetical protein A2960_01640 [Candidatus Gottesmanbacteria bacterium RIFCSPLOWO2_01_FULL_39_12b]|uniref:Small-conductance mechanosensitive ion channel n=1 Tax=Candidatus Gottesmanbacteria bacterium RIFCSPLOWO2_01_FULL_39_12b TaxID=1798388 RepID=A0A1F6AQA3_9BACT|nr:MAG: hypothetical protein A2960_01640 [Candidatus Gottesmanbacteria bacterium RIFCSPLOWO2_01_FULL_39_12b]